MPKSSTDSFRPLPYCLVPSPVTTPKVALASTCLTSPFSMERNTLLLILTPMSSMASLALSAHYCTLAKRHIAWPFRMAPWWYQTRQRHHSFAPVPYIWALIVTTPLCFQIVLAPRPPRLPSAPIERVISLTDIRATCAKLNCTIHLTLPRAFSLPAVPLTPTPFIHSMSFQSHPSHILPIPYPLFLNSTACTQVSPNCPSPPNLHSLLHLFPRLLLISHTHMLYTTCHEPPKIHTSAHKIPITHTTHAHPLIVHHTLIEIYTFSQHTQTYTHIQKQTCTALDFQLSPLHAKVFSF